METHGPIQSVTRTDSGPARVADLLSQVRPGQVLLAQVERLHANNEVELRIGNQVIRANSPVRLTAGQPITLVVEKSASGPELRISQPPSESSVLSSALRTVLPKQESLAKVIDTLANTLNNRPTAPVSTSRATSAPPPPAPLPAPVRTAIQTLISSVPTVKTVSQAPGLQQAIKDSGVSLESHLLRSAISGRPPETRNDFKANLLRVASTVLQYQSGLNTNTTATATTSTTTRTVTQESPLATNTATRTQTTTPPPAGTNRAETISRALTPEAPRPANPAVSSSTTSSQATTTQTAPLASRSAGTTTVISTSTPLPNASTTRPETAATTNTNKTGVNTPLPTGAGRVTAPSPAPTNPNLAQTVSQSATPESPVAVNPASKPASQTQVTSGVQTVNRTLIADAPQQASPPASSTTVNKAIAANAPSQQNVAPTQAASKGTTLDVPPPTASSTKPTSQAAPVVTNKNPGQATVSSSQAVVAGETTKSAPQASTTRPTNEIYTSQAKPASASQPPPTTTDKSLLTPRPLLPPLPTAAQATTTTAPSTEQPTQNNLVGIIPKLLQKILPTGLLGTHQQAAVTQAAVQANPTSPALLNMVNELLNQLESGLARIQQHQINSMPGDETIRHILNLELPVFNGKGYDNIGLAIEWHDQQKDQEINKHQWRVVINFNFDELGEVQAIVRAQQDEIHTEFRSKNDIAQQVFSSYSNLLEKNLRDRGLTPGKFTFSAAELETPSDHPLGDHIVKTKA